MRLKKSCFTIAACLLTLPLPLWLAAQIAESPQQGQTHE
jgi:hypothetical protein